MWDGIDKIPPEGDSNLKYNSESVMISGIYITSTESS